MTLKQKVTQHYIDMESAVKYLVTSTTAGRTNKITNIHVHVYYQHMKEHLINVIEYRRTNIMYYRRYHQNQVKEHCVVRGQNTLQMLL